jgi:hypothetical protein
VHVQGFLTTELVELAFFPPTGSVRSSPSSRAYERLRELWLWHYLERVELPVARVLGGRRPFLYALGQPGVRFVEQRIGTAALPVQARRLDRLDHVFVDHDLQAAAFWANLAAQLRTFTPTVRRWTWLGERELRARRMRVRNPERGFWLPFLPDAYFEVVHADGRVQCAIVEVDMGTLTLRRFAREVRLRGRLDPGRVLAPLPARQVRGVRADPVRAPPERPAAGRRSGRPRHAPRPVLLRDPRRPGVRGRRLDVV